MGRRRNEDMRITVPCAVAIVLAVLLGACGRSTELPGKAQSLPTVQVALATVEKRSVEAPYEAVGTVRARTVSTLQSKMMGHVQAVNVREGDRVVAGQVLIEIDAREAESQVKRAESALLEAQQVQQEVGNVIQAAMRSKDAAEAGNALASSTFDRYKGLSESQAVSRQVFDEAGAKLKGAAAEAARAAEMVLSAHAKRGEANARIEQAKAELSNAQTMLSFAKVTAPFAGIITRKSVDVGDLAVAGSPLLVVEDPQQYRIEALADEEQVHRIATGAKVPVTLDALGEDDQGHPVLLDGTVAEIVPSADPISRTFVVKIDLPQNPAIRSGMFGRARFDVGQKQTITIPETAVFHRGQLAGVYVVVEDNIARLRLITVGERYGSGVEVLSGLEPGERVVADKTGEVSDGGGVGTSR